MMAVANKGQARALVLISLATYYWLPDRDQGMDKPLADAVAAEDLARMRNLASRSSPTARWTSATPTPAGAGGTSTSTASLRRPGGSCRREATVAAPSSTTPSPATHDRTVTTRWLSCHGSTSWPSRRGARAGRAGPGADVSARRLPGQGPRDPRHEPLSDRAGPLFG